MVFYVASGSSYMPGRDPLVDDVMQSWQERYCTFSDVRLCVSTFNVNGRSAPRSIPGWFPIEERADFYVVGLQEMDLSIGTHIIDNQKKEIEWVNCIHQSLPSGLEYVKVKSHRLVGIFIIMFKSVRCSVTISNEISNMVATGIPVMGTKLGNKGGTGISLMMNDSLICFVNSHLAAGNSELERRNQDFHDITAIFDTFPNRTLFNHDVVFWLGDLNYRLVNETPYSTEEIRRKACSEKASELLQYDQLFIEQRKGAAFKGFLESSPQFRPTYKYDVGTNQWDSSEKARVPAWCDRILWKTRDADILVEQTAYDSIDSIAISDHKPVRAYFLLRLRKIDQAKADKLYGEACKEADRRANEMLPQIALSASDIDFGEVFFNKAVNRMVTVTNTGKCTVTVRFRSRPNHPSISAAWIQVTPTSCSVPPGSDVQISLTINIDKQAAWSLFADGKEALQDILVLNLDSGRDYFIVCSAKYCPQVFGVSLLHLRARVQCEVDLINFGNSESSSNLPEGIPREIYRLVTALRNLGHLQLNLREEIVENTLLFLLREALENNAPNDLTQVPGITAIALYKCLLWLLDSLTEPIIPQTLRDDLYANCTSPIRLWNDINSRLDHQRIALIDFLTTYLRELCSLRAEAREDLKTWAQVLFRDNGTLATPRLQALTSLVEYARDVIMLNSSSSVPVLPHIQSSPAISGVLPSRSGVPVRLAPPVPPHRARPNSQFYTSPNSSNFL